MAAAATAGAGPATASKKVTTYPQELSFEMSLDETLGGLIKKIIQVSKTENYIGLSWEGREDYISGPNRATMSKDNQYFIQWCNYPEPEIYLSSSTPRTIQQRLGIGTGTTVKDLPPGLFDRVKVMDVCDLNHDSSFGVTYYRAAGRRASLSALASSPAAPPSLAGLSSLASVSPKDPS